MALKKLVAQFVAQARAGKLEQAKQTVAKILQEDDTSIKLKAGAKNLPVEDLEEMETELTAVRDEVSKPPTDGGTPANFDPTVWVSLAELVIKLILERRRRRHPE